MCLLFSIQYFEFIVGNAKQFIGQLVRLRNKLLLDLKEI